MTGMRVPNVDADLLEPTKDSRDAMERRRKLATHGAALLVAAAVVKLVVFHATCVIPAAFTFAAGAMALMTDLCILLAVFALLLFVRREWACFAMAATLNVMLTVVTYANVIHFRFYGDAIAAYKIGMATMVDDTASAVGVMLGLLDVLFFIDWMAVGVWAAFKIAWFPASGLAARARELLDRSPRALPLKLAGGAVAVAILVQILWRPTSIPEPLRTAEVMSRSSMFAYYTAGAARALIGAQPKLKKIVLVEEVCTCGRVARGPSSDSDLPGGKDTVERIRAAQKEGVKPNFLLVQVESLNPEALRPEVMPNLCALAGQGMRFTRFHSFAYLALTFRGEYSLMTSLYPPLGERMTYAVAGSIREGRLIDLLKGEGYATWFLHGYTGSFYRRRANYRAWGVENLYFQEELTALGVKPGRGFGHGPDGPGIDDEDMSRTIPKILATTPRPYFAMYVTLSSHFPYTVPGEKKRIVHRGVARPREHEGAYAKMMKYVDRELGVLFDGLRSRGLLEDTYVFIYADHRGRMESVARYHDRLASPTAERLGAFVKQHRVPCIVIGPGIEPSRTEMRSSHLDIAPTVLDLAGIATPRGDGKVMGRSLLEDCTCRVWALPTLTDAVVLAGPSGFGHYGRYTRQLTYYGLPANLAAEPREAEAEAVDRYRALVSRALYSEWVFMHEGKPVPKSPSR